MASPHWRNKPLEMPPCFWYFAWCLCTINILACSAVVVLYGMSFGNKKSLQWLSSITVGLIQDILVLQPAKMLCMALFAAIVVKNVDEEEKAEVEKKSRYLAADEEWIYKMSDDELLHLNATSSIEPPDISTLEEARKLRFKERQMVAIIKELAFYAFFTFIVLQIAFLSREPWAYTQNRGILELFRLRVRRGRLWQSGTVFHKVQSYKDFWEWTDKLLLPQLYPSPWFKDIDGTNPKLKTFPGKLFVNDLASKIVNGVRFRQVRVKKDSCSMAGSVKNYVQLPCASPFDGSVEEDRDFLHSWDNVTVHSGTLLEDDKPWTYQSWTDLDSYPIWAEKTTYPGGGYVVDLFPRWDNKAILNDLKQKMWVDRHTRALMIEFALFNPSTNGFNMVFIVFEFPAMGSIVHYYSVTTFKMYRFTENDALTRIVLEVLFVLCSLFFAVREARIIYRTSLKKYIKLFWSQIELAILILSLSAICVSIYREDYAFGLLRRIPDKKPNVFINFSHAAQLYISFTCIMSIIVFFVMIKFIKLLRFNKRICLLSNTLKAAWEPLSMFSIILGIVLIGTMMAANVLFHTELYGYRTFTVTVASIFDLMLGKFEYHQFGQSNRLLGPIFFMSFNVMINWIIMNMFISILDESFHRVQEDLRLQTNEHEIIDYILQHIKGLINSYIRDPLQDVAVAAKDTLVNAASLHSLNDDLFGKKGDGEKDPGIEVARCWDGADICSLSSVHEDEELSLQPVRAEVTGLKRSEAYKQLEYDTAHGEELIEKVDVAVHRAAGHMTSCDEDEEDFYQFLRHVVFMLSPTKAETNPCLSDPFNSAYYALVLKIVRVLKGLSVDHSDASACLKQDEDYYKLVQKLIEIYSVSPPCLIDNAGSESSFMGSRDDSNGIFFSEISTISLQ